MQQQVHVTSKKYGKFIVEDIDEYYDMLNNHITKTADFDKKYNRNSFSVVLRGSSIEFFPNSIDERNKEIANIEDIEHNAVMILNKEEFIGKKNEDLNDEERKNLIDDYTILVKVSNRQAYEKLLIRWPENAFLSGIVPVLVPNEKLPVIFYGIELDVPIHFLQEKLAERGLLDVKRGSKDGKINTIVRANAISGIDYINIIKNGIHFNPRKRMPKPSTYRCTSCPNCLSPICKTKDCNKPTNCGRCGISGHSATKCMETENCFACGGKHYNDSEKCAVWRTRFYKENDYVIKILLDANLITSRRELLFNPESDDTDAGKALAVTADLPNEIKLKFKSYDERLNNIEKEQKESKTSIELSEEKVKNVSTEVECIKKECKTIHTKIDTYNLTQTKRLDTIDKNCKITDANIVASKLEILGAIKRK